jgi:hypothetical protein
METVMKILKSTFLGLGSSVIGITLLTMPASAINFSFSFENALENPFDSVNSGGSVTGIIRGLEEGTGAATSVEVLSNTAGYGLGEYVGSPDYNSWTVLDGNLVAFIFYSLGILNTPPAVTNATLFFESSEILGASFRAGITSSPIEITTGSDIVETEDINLTFTRLDNPEPVLEPTSILSLLVVSVAAMGTTFKRKQA